MKEGEGEIREGKGRRRRTGEWRRGEHKVGGGGCAGQEVVGVDVRVLKFERLHSTRSPSNR